MQERAIPFDPPLVTEHLPAPGGEVGSAFDDFRVDEIPLYQPSGEGPHYYVHLRKTNWTTQKAMDALAKTAGVRSRDIGRAGLKDRNAVTTQWLSVNAEVCSSPEGWELPEGMEILNISRHSNKLKPGHLLANRFGLRFVGSDREALLRVVESLQETGYMNAYGYQRFGRGGRNLDRALAWLRGEIKLRGKKARFDQQLYSSVVQSEFFNRYASERLALGDETALTGEWVRLSGAGKGFLVEDAAEASERLKAGDIVLTGPMPGPRTATAGEAAALEEKVWAAMNMDEELRQRLFKEVGGTRRDLMVHPEGLSVEDEGDGVRVSFALPSGSFASQLAREITRLPWHSPLRVETPAESAPTDSP